MKYVYLIALSAFVISFAIDPAMAGGDGSNVGYSTVADGAAGSSAGGGGIMIPLLILAILAAAAASG